MTGSNRHHRFGGPKYYRYTNATWLGRKGLNLHTHASKARDYTNLSTSQFGEDTGIRTRIMTLKVS